MTTPINTLTLSFPFSIERYNIPAFRSAIIDLIDREAHWFHNHNNDPKAGTDYRWEYPLIRYFVDRNRAQIMGIGEGAEAIATYLVPRLLQTPTLVMRNQSYSTVGFRMKNQQIEPQWFAEPMPFGIHRWVALSNNNYKTWKSLEGNDRARRQLLNRTLTGHLRGMATLLAPEINKEDIHAEIIRVDNVKRIRWHKAQIIGFSVVAESRFVPPVGLGVGRMVSFGFGSVKSAKDYQEAILIKDNKSKTSHVR